MMLPTMICCARGYAVADGPEKQYLPISAMLARRRLTGLRHIPLAALRKIYTDRR